LSGVRREYILCRVAGNIVRFHNYGMRVPVAVWRLSELQHPCYFTFLFFTITTTITTTTTTNALCHLWCADRRERWSVCQTSCSDSAERRLPTPCARSFRGCSINSTALDANVSCQHCPRSMRNRVCVTSIRLSVPSFDRSSGVQRVCC